MLSLVNAIRPMKSIEVAFKKNFHLHVSVIRTQNFSFPSYEMYILTNEVVVFLFFQSKLNSIDGCFSTRIHSFKQWTDSPFCWFLFRTRNRWENLWSSFSYSFIISNILQQLWSMVLWHSRGRQVDHLQLSIDFWRIWRKSNWKFFVTNRIVDQMQHKEFRNKF